VDKMIYCGDARELLPQFEPESVHCCITSPPYWGLRDYKLEPLVWGGTEGCEHEWGNGVRVSQGNRRQIPHGDGRVNDSYRDARIDYPAQKVVIPVGFCSLCGAWRGSLGLEPTPELYVQHLVEIFREVRRVLRKDGTLWLVMGDSYATTSGGGQTTTQTNVGGDLQPRRIGAGKIPGIKPKDLIGVPWMTAFALRDDGWYLRCPIVWHKPNCMPSSQKDRPTLDYEHIFLLAKSARYYYDGDAIKEPAAESGQVRAKYPRVGHAKDVYGDGITNLRNPSTDEASRQREMESGSRNRRSVWTIATQPFKGAHFATFPPKLIEPCILAGCPEGGAVLDPFCGSGTVGVVCKRLDRRFAGIDLSSYYCEMAMRRIDSAS
jgi:DNA modification methylase